MADVTGTFYPVADDVKLGYGVQLLVGVGNSPEDFVAVKGVMTITPGAITSSIIDVTHLRSPNAHKEKTSGIRDSGPFSVKCDWLPDDDSQSNQGGNNTTIAPGLLYLNINRLASNFKIILNDGSPATEWPFRGKVTSFQPGEINVDSAIMLTVEITPMADYSDDLP